MAEYLVQVQEGTKILEPPYIKEQAENMGPLPSIIEWYPCNYGDYRPGVDMIGQGYIVDKAVVYPIIPMPDNLMLDSRKRLKEKELRVEGNEKLSVLVGPYQPAERETWGYQLNEAMAFLSDPTSATPVIDAITQGRGVTKEDLVNKIMENANLFRVASGQILGQQQALIDRVYAATTIEELAAISW